MEYTELDIDDIICVNGDEFYKIIESDEEMPLSLEPLTDVEECEACGEFELFDGYKCPACDHDQRKPVMGGYDPELDEG